MNWTTIEPKVNGLKQGVLSIMGKIESLTLADKDHLPKLNDSFFNVKKAIQDPTYDVVVCGEVKKGKSSLLNAIVGKQILPVANEIATSQVFRIAHSETESYSLVFTDGTKEAITYEQLGRYGSQVDAILQGEPIFKDRTLDYIQVNIPVAFLPKGVNLVDTPGLGALYKRHEYITQNYVKKASAVIFVMDPSAPLVDQEKVFISKVLEITPNILFVMTKIDMYNEEVYRNVIERNEEILALIYAEKGKKAPRIYPISSMALDRVKEIPKELEPIREANLQASKFPEVKHQLFLTIYRTVGLYHSYIALQESKNAVQKAMKVIADLKKAAAVKNKEEETRLTQELNNKIREMGNEWGDDSQQRVHVQNSVSQICNSVRSFASQMVSSTGSIYKSYATKIEELGGFSEAKSFAENMGSELANDISRQWMNIMDDAREDVNNELAKLDSDLECSAYGQAGVRVSSSSFKMTWKDYLPPVRNTFFITTLLGGILLSIFGPLGALVAGVLGAIGGWKLFQDDVRKKLMAALNKSMQEIGVSLLQVSPGSRLSLVDEFINELNQSTNEAIKQIYANRAGEIEKQKEQLINQAKRTVEERKNDLKKWDDMMAEWNPLVAELGKAIDTRTDLAADLGIKYNK